ncbi:NlpC-P60 family hydrolase [Bacteriovorax sp. BAL6_X]|uniref:YiiX/YebB-like N1pC/P60 family cysteine hydrolase n=1 Tax=Bacteriovorax sp. BAL6_X TaxID=1201290 RepID=UPI0003857EAF|nr:YiiX/YebB-like N1pC/P60 family cysteine hydrolase [Bacteriovorax sp. BAL6_X]EPZ51089.1 NlpC-P60 family hydrolase [Bacteriovorax sp. BAL6_X]
MIRKSAIVAIMATSIFVTSCSKDYANINNRKISSVSLYGPEIETYYDHEELENYQNRIEEILVWRHKAIDFIIDIQEQKVLRSNQITTMHEEGTETYKRFRDSVWPKIEEVKWVVDKYNEIYIVKDRPSEVLNKKKKVRRSHAQKRSANENFRWQKYKEITINPTDELGKALIYDMKMAIATSLVMYDNYMIVLSQIQEMKKIRHLINYDNAELKNQLAKITFSYNKYDNYNRIERGLEIYQKLLKFDYDNKVVPDRANYYLDSLIQSSQSFEKVNKEFKKGILGRKLSMIWRYIGDYFKEGKNNATHIVSKGFGNTAGLVQTRRGKLYDPTPERIQELESQLEPLDVLLEKTPFRLTDKFIPGHWGHVAIWTGNKSQLQELGIWDHPEVVPFHDEIENKGKRIIEALRPGVQYNTLHHFMDIDDLAAVRYQKELTREQKQDYLINAFKQVGKVYDFNFDVETDERIVCSELAYVTFDDMEWPVAKAAGRYTISPDNVGEKVGDEKSFTTILLIHDGKEVAKNLNENFAQLMKDSTLIK